MDTKSALLRLWEMGAAEHGRLARAIFTACVGVLCGMLPYIAAAQIIIGLLHGETAMNGYLWWCALALAGFVLRAALYTWALGMSHTATFEILRQVRAQILTKLPKLPLGVMIDTPSGELKQVSPTTLVTVLPVGWLLYQSGSLEMETFITTIILSLGIAGPLLAAMNFVDDLAKVGTTVGEVDAILAAPEQDHGAAMVALGQMDITLSHVSFGYHEGEEILHDVSLEIPAGSMTALVGPSGSGKSTIAKLIAGFWDAPEGRITLAGHDLREIPLAQLYDQVAFVAQDTYLFDDTVRENIRMGRPSASDVEIEQVAKLAGCDDFIRNLENGYDTRVGGGGAHLSGGERQRITIARAMLKDAPVVILDEATAYIDPENEAIIQQAVAQLVRGKTVIVVAHRLSTIVDADQICVVDKGCIVTSGRHEALLDTCALYREMWLAHIGGKDGDAK